MRLFLDDDREPPDDTWTVVRTADAAIAAIKACPAADFEAMSFDHDLGACAACVTCKGWGDPCGCRCHLSGYTVVVWMETEDRWPRTRPTVHSQNPVGRAKIEAAINRKWSAS